MAIEPEQRRDCFDRAVHAFGSAYIFERRATQIGRAVRILTFLGLAGPLSLGLLIGAFKLSPNYLELAVGVAAIVGIFQAILTLWSLVCGWNEKLAYYLESKNANSELATELEDLGKESNVSDQDFLLRHSLLREQDKNRRQRDSACLVTPKELRMGMSRGLWKFQRPCVKCKKVPSEGSKSDCDVCGNF